MAKGEAVEIARFLIQRRFAAKDAVLKAGRRLRQLQASGVRTPFLEYLYQEGIIGDEAFAQAQEHFFGPVEPAPPPARAPADEFAFRSSVVDEIPSSDDDGPDDLAQSYEVTGGQITSRQSRSPRPEPSVGSTLFTAGGPAPEPDEVEYEIDDLPQRTPTAAFMEQEAETLLDYGSKPELDQSIEITDGRAQPSRRMDRPRPRGHDDQDATIIEQPGGPSDLDQSFEITGGQSRPSRQMPRERPTERAFPPRPAPAAKGPEDRKEWGSEATVFLDESARRSAQADTLIEGPQRGGGLDRPSSRPMGFGSSTGAGTGGGLDRASSWGTGGGLDRPSTGWGSRPSSQLDRSSGLGRSSSVGGAGGRAELQAGDSFAAFRILEVQERSDLGRVYKAHDLDLDRVVLLKLLPEESLDSDDDARRITGHIEILASLDHPNVISVYNGGTHGGYKYFTLEYIAGRRLDEYVRDEAPTPEKGLAIAREVAGAVEYAHRKGLVHAGLDPESVRIDEAGNPHIIDFWRNAGSMGGGGRSAIDADLGALGRVLYLVLTGIDPRESAGDSLRGPVPADQLDPRIPATVADLSLRALSSDPVDRFGGAGELSEEIDRCLRQLRPTGRRRGRSRAIFRWLGRLGAAAAVLAFLGAIGYGAYWGIDRLRTDDKPVVTPGPDDTDEHKPDVPDDPPPRIPPDDPPTPEKKPAGRLTLASDPPGYEVSLVEVDPVAFTRGKSETIGRTPLERHDLPEGNYSIELYKIGASPERIRFPLTIEKSEFDRVREIRIEIPPDAPDDMVYVPKGPIGSGAAAGSLDVPAFFFDRQPVTNEDYRAFLQDTGQAAPPHWRDGRIPTGWERRPVTNITYREAWLFALWAGKRLPRPREFLKAALGTDDRKLPWGNRLEGLHDHFRTITSVQTAEPIVVGLFPKSESPYGCQDMYGNVVFWSYERPNAQGQIEFAGKMMIEQSGSIRPQPLTGTGDPNLIRAGLVGLRCARSALEVRTGKFDELTRLAGPGYLPDDRIEAMRRLHLLRTEQAFNRLLDLVVAEANGDETLRLAAAFYASRAADDGAVATLGRRFLQSRNDGELQAIAVVLGLMKDPQARAFLEQVYPRLSGPVAGQVFEILADSMPAEKRLDLALAEFGRTSDDAVRTRALTEIVQQKSVSGVGIVRAFLEEYRAPIELQQAPPILVTAFQYMGQTNQVDFLLDRLFSERPVESLLAAQGLRATQSMIGFEDAMAAARRSPVEVTRILIVINFAEKKTHLSTEQKRLARLQAQVLHQATKNAQFRQILEQIMKALES